MLKELDRVGVKGKILEIETRERNHVIIDAANRLAAQKNCGPLHVRTLEAAMARGARTVQE